MNRVRALAAVTGASVFIVVAAVTASAQTGAESVSLEASATKIVFGDDVRLSGATTPATGDQTIEIRDSSDTVVGTATTGAAGNFSLTVSPDGSETYRAVWASATSEPVTVRVRALVTVHMTEARLFDDVVVRGTVEPARPGRRVDIALIANGRVVLERRIEIGSAGGFSTRLRVMTPGTIRARASFATDDLLRGTAVTSGDTTPLPSLRSGSRGVFVGLLEDRLVELDYRLAGASDGQYDFRTADAVVAFHKVQRMSRVFSVSSSTWRALADPIRPRPERDWRGLYIEVDQTRQVLYTVRDGEVTNILHVSTGANGATRDGSFSVYRKLAGYSANRLYYPSYFDGLRALHGWTEVPTYPASHGCVRIPYWNAIWTYRQADFGTRVVIYH